MAYDRFVAICHPLHYSVLMRPTVCASMVAGTWLSALLNALIHVIYSLNLPYCASREIHHFFCEIPALLKLVCADTSLYENGLFVSGVIFLLIPISAIMVSYGQILSTILSLRSNVGMSKALATCSSHMIVVSLFYGTAMIKYFLPNTYRTSEQDEIVSVFYTILIPMLNPLIYSLRNKEVAGAFRKVLGRRIS
ncbi:olfactory receptor 2AG2-like [Dasypus novemcinctus]|uniref:olfactory receptor 2AG2-like n=1 Tax=Dasypus novemcinctus TaxID=9361 RepID=UPI00062A7955|nr:olfactory receptor 2AG2-like [Dasypus novemcinctus]